MDELKSRHHKSASDQKFLMPHNSIEIDSDLIRIIRRWALNYPAHEECFFQDWDAGFIFVNSSERKDEEYVDPLSQTGL